MENDMVDIPSFLDRDMQTNTQQNISTHKYLTLHAIKHYSKYIDLSKPGGLALSGRNEVSVRVFPDLSFISVGCLNFKKKGMILIGF